MPCLILTGYPCSGKTTLANLIRDVALEHFGGSISNVVIVTDATATAPASAASAYANSFVEKSTRASLKSDFDRVVNRTSSGSSGEGGQKQTLVILDSLNYIKGYRYELHCISKAAQQRHGVVWVLNSVETVLRWNRDRSEVNQRYDEALLRELVARYEPPDARNRWDSPLYEIDVRPTADPIGSAQTIDRETSSAPSKSKASVLEEALEHSVYDMHKLSSTLPEKATPTPTTAESTTNLQGSLSPSRSPTSASDPPSANSGTAKPKRAVFKRPTKKQAAQSTSHVESEHVNESSTPVVERMGPSTVQTDRSATEALPASSASRSADDNAGITAKSLEGRVLDMLRSFLSDENKPLQAGTSTIRHDVSDPNTLNQIDSVTLQVCDALAKSGAAAGNSNSFSLFGETFARSQSGAPRTMSLSELRRLRGQYMQWVAAYPPDDVDATSPPSIVRSFLAYLDAHRR